MREILTISTELFQRWNERGIKYCHWKSNEHLYEGLIGDTDLDVLVCLDDKEEAERSLIECGFRKVIPQYGSRYDLLDDWIGCDSDKGRLIHIHLHYKMITGHKGLKEYDLPWTELALGSRKLHDEFPVYVIDPNLELLVLLSRICLKATFLRVVKSMLHKFRLSNSDRAEFKYLHSIADKKNVSNIAKDYFGKDCDTMTDLVFSSDFTPEWFFSSRRIVHRHLAACNRYGIRAFFGRPYYCFAFILRHGWKKITEASVITKKVLPQGAIIAFIGQDGAGKSTVSDEVLKWLTWKMDARKYYLGSGEHYRSWQKTLRSKIHRRSGIAGVIHNVLVVSDLKKIAKVTWKKIRAADRYASKGGIALFDRYPQIQYAGINDGPKIRVNIRDRKLPPVLKKWLLQYAKAEEKYLRRAIEVRPDLVFRMTLTPEESIRRKPEESLEKVTKKHEIIKELKFDGAEVISIDAAQDYSEEICLIHRTIWGFISNRG